jgi:hypothetical protein
MKRRIIIVGGIAMIVLLLAGAAFVGGQLLSGQGLPGLGPAGGLTMFTSQGGKGGQGQRISIQTIPAKELPQTPADARGIFDHRKDNSIFVGTGNVHMMVMTNQSGQVQTSSSHTGPTVEVVVSPQTIVYRDVTMQQYNGGEPPSSSGTIKVQQAVEPGSLDEIGENSDITAWGKKTGDRIIADVLVYTPPPVLNAKP